MNGAALHVEPSSGFSYLPASCRQAQLLRDAGVLERSTLMARDGRRLAVYQAGDRRLPTVLLVNALGMSALFLAALAGHLATSRHVVTWETRGLPDSSDVALDEDLSVARHAFDAADVLAGIGRSAAALVSYCSGVNIATHALAHGLLIAPRLCIVSPSIALSAAQHQTDYQRTMLPLWRDIASSGLRRAGFVHQLLRDADFSSTDGVHRELRELNNLPFATVESTYLYARMQAGCLETSVQPELSSLTASTLILHCGDDDIIHEDTARTLAVAIRRCRYERIPDADHFGIYTSAALHRRVARFILGETG